GAIRSYGDILNWLKEDLNLFDDYNQASALAFGLSDNQGVYLIPALAGLGAPFWRPNVNASFVGLTRDTDKSHLIRAGFEAMAFQTKAVIDEFEKTGGVKIDSLRVDGGSIKNKKFMQLLSDVVERDIIVNNIEEVSALGTLLILEEVKMDKISNYQIYKPKNNFKDSYIKWKSYMKVFLNKDRKSTRLNSSHVSISYAVFCLKKKKK